ncbi:hypothetical protein WISP_87611 [Willisornis vidua]|uniref:Uncharacterized protein n=1 Tax=Willisornis vidua TaxID=1566151 RepID=A0ABQ9D2N0_9PASS|nr:hypothetical protein WISP_87611 [Willisornis vidua]
MRKAVSDQLSHLDPHKSMGPDGIHPKVMRELVEELAKQLSIIYHQSWLTGEVSHDWKLSNMMSIHKKEGRHRKLQPDLSAQQGYGTDQLECDHTAYMGWTGMRPSQHRFRRGRSCLTTLISFYDQVICLTRRSA